ncbi:hydroxymethylglutaryl-CoA lyase [Paenalkalicoccus suaedae]|uniref:Hydroxymethylglutaryl-CoA lyase n=1 Tax=Paenalkalicoccus suaedae TaxID=2592382 RepID=A0A859FDS6_9BACI|nr:hydroxymethylglutaryl-CoA lyase [Paenalkalicoccus suaedae]QKS70724.1 hydroxymethylglutaryl-CoA lyase [Paenalkalicoccus suaedae]
MSHPFITVKEVGPRDGLQNETQIVSTEDKVKWIEELADTGLTHIEVSSFVSPKWIPALADAKDVFAMLTRKKGVTYSALVPNEKGLEAALLAGVDEVAVFMSASETHNKKNINKTIQEALVILEQVVQTAKQEKKQVRGYLSTVFGCPYEGEVAVSQVASITESLLQMGVDEVSLGDTIGIAHPLQVKHIMKEMEHVLPKLALHFHNTRGLASANVLAGLEAGVTTFDGAAGGIGGCPYAEGATGNIATEDLVYMLHAMGYETSVDLAKLTEAARFMERTLQKELPSYQLKL